MSCPANHKRIGMHGINTDHTRDIGPLGCVVKCCRFREYAAFGTEKGIQRLGFCRSAIGEYSRRGVAGN